MEPLDVVISLAMVCLVIYFYIDNKYSFWASRDVPFIKPKFAYGNVKELSRTVHISELFQKFYHEMKGSSPFGGMYFFISPVALALDLDFVKNVLVRDFEYFHDRGTYYNEKDDPISAHLFNMEGNKWRTLRSKLTPTFTSGKMKMMFPTFIAVGEQFKDFLLESVDIDPEIEMKDVLGRFTTDVIGNCAFGIDCNSLREPDSLFRTMGKQIFNEPRTKLNGLIVTSSHKLARFLKIKNVKPEVSDFYMKVVKDTIEYREAHNIQRNDFMDLLIRLKNTGSVDENGSNSGSLTMDEIAAQAFIFFFAGFETSSTTMTYCLHEFSQNQDIQDKARQCVKDVLKKHNGHMTYEAAMEMTYLDQCINETLRKHPPVSIHVRVASKDYEVPNTKTIIPKGTLVMIPVYAIQRDPEFYPEPEKFDPNRFTPEEIGKRNPYSFIPFGEGPRICIGLRFGMMQTRIGLAYLLNNFKFSSCSRSSMPLVNSKRSIILSPEGGMWLKVEKLKQ